MTIRLVDPADRRTVLERAGDVYRSPAGQSYPIRNGVADFVATTDVDQRQTSDSFGFKWNRQPDWGFGSDHQQVVREVWADVFGWADGTLEQLMRDRVVLDAGCGSGASLNQFVQWPAVIAAADISEAIHACYTRFAARHPQIVFARADLTQLPFEEAAFDVIWCAGVLHHTPDTRASLKALIRHLRPGGRIVFYVYVTKAPIREFVDDYLRAQIADLPPAEAWVRMEALTHFARSLSAVKAQLIVEHNVPDLGFVKGSYDIQRFVYYNLFKCFWNDALSFDDNVHVNFDWYHPKYAHRHTPDEVRGWLAPLGLEAEHFHVSGSGIAVIGRRTA